MFSSIKKLLGNSESDKATKQKGLVSSLSFNLRDKSEKFSQFIGEKLDSAREEFFTIKEKCKDLHKTNFDLGNRHLEKGNLSEAILRFRIIKKFWPNDFDAYYQLAYCLVLKNKPRKARRVLEELLEKDPGYDPLAQELLDHLNQILS